MNAHLEDRARAGASPAGPDEDERSGFFSRLPAILFGLGVAGLIFGYGVAVGVFKIFPFGLLNNAAYAAADLARYWKAYAGVEASKLVERSSHHPGTGVTRLDARRAAPGLTFAVGLFGGRPAMRLMELDGTVVRHWAPSYSAIFPNTDHVEAEFLPFNDLHTSIHGAVALPDGSVAFNFPRLGLAKLDRCGAVEWRLDRPTHHVVSVAGDGGFWAADARFHDERPDAELPFLDLPFREDTIIKVSPSGELVREISPMRALHRAGLTHLLLPNAQSGVRNDQRDILHLNEVEELGAAEAAAFPMFAEGDLLISLRNLNVIAVMDPRTEAIKWWQAGPWVRQHDPSFMADGRIAVFDNRFDQADGTALGGSRVVAVDPRTSKVDVLVEGPPEKPLYTEIMGRVQVLPNGNILLSETNRGRFLEVTPAGEPVWEYVNRLDERRVGVAVEAHRYPPGYFQVSDWSCPTPAEETPR